MHLDVRAFGPAPLKQMTEAFLRAYKTTVRFLGRRFQHAATFTVEVKEVSAKSPRRSSSIWLSRGPEDPGHRLAVEALPDGRIARFRAT